MLDELVELVVAAGVVAGPALLSTPAPQAAAPHDAATIDKAMMRVRLMAKGPCLSHQRGPVAPHPDDRVATAEWSRTTC